MSNLVPVASDADELGEPIYAVIDAEREYRQGEIISNLVQYEYRIVDNELEPTLTPFVVLASQDCDLMRDFEARQSNDRGVLNQILAFEAEEAEKALAEVKGSDIRKRIKNNKDERYHLLTAAISAQDALGEGLPALLVDFRSYFTIPPAQLMAQCGGATSAKRRCRLLTPYREHFQFRAAVYLSRIGLPRDHKL